MRAVFVELPAFSRHRASYLDDDELSGLQAFLMAKPDRGVLIDGAGGLRKLRFADHRRHKGRRSGLRVIYFWWEARSQFWLFTIYDKDEMRDLSANERRSLKEFLKFELGKRL